VSFRKLEDEYSAYRKRAVGLIKQVDEQNARLTDELGALRSKLRAAAGADEAGGQGSARTPGGAAAGLRPASSPGGPGATTEARLAYLRKLLVKFLSSDDASVRSSLESALIAVAELAPGDVLAIKRARAESGGVAAWLGLGGASTSPTAQSPAKGQLQFTLAR